MSLELEHLLSPINEQQPCGTDYSFSNEFHAIKKAKTQDDLLLEQGDWVSEPKQADWAFVASQSVELLTEKTKDIRVYTWLLEAWSHLHGFEGILKSMELMQRSLDAYWLHLFPELDEDDLDQRIGLLQGFISLLPAMLKTVPIVSAAPYFNLADYDALLYKHHQKRKQSQDGEADETEENAMEHFEQTLQQTSKSIQYQHYQQFSAILEHWQSLKNTLDQILGIDSPSFAALDSQIESIHLSLKKIYKADAFMQAATPAADASSSSASLSVPVQDTADFESAHQANSFQPQPQNHLANREQAMRVLQEISDYFQLNEPHSPVSYMLQKTIRWSQMPLHEWLSQVIKNETPLENIHEVLGVQKDAPSDW